MISFDEVNDGLLQLGFDGGWAYSDVGYPEGLVIWEHSDPMPSVDDLKTAARLWAETVEKRAEANQAKREALLKKLGLTDDEFQSLVSST
jgi:hypothetical protein